MVVGPHFHLASLLYFLTNHDLFYQVWISPRKRGERDVFVFPLTLQYDLSKVFLIFL